MEVWAACVACVWSHPAIDAVLAGSSGRRERGQRAFGVWHRLDPAQILEVMHGPLCAGCALLRLSVASAEGLEETLASTRRSAFSICWLRKKWALHLQTRAALAATAPGVIQNRQHQLAEGHEELSTRQYDWCLHAGTVPC